MSDFERENRYSVAKHTDIRRYLTSDEIHELCKLLGKVDAGRVIEGKKYLNCVVVEDDWPEYESVWEAIEKRVLEGEHD